MEAHVDGSVFMPTADAFEAPIAMIVRFPQKRTASKPDPRFWAASADVFGDSSSE